MEQDNFAFLMFVYFKLSAISFQHFLQISDT